MSFRNMLFREFVKMLAISVKIIFLEPGKFENIQKLSPTFKNYAKPRIYINILFRRYCLILDI